MKEGLKSEAAKKLLDEYDKAIKKKNGRLLVRPSGTEELIRITMWGEDENDINYLANQLRKELEKTL